MKTLNIFLVSDATGTTAEAVVTSVLVQFTGASSRIRRFPFVRTVAQVEEVVAQAPAGECIIVFTFVHQELSQAMLELGQAKKLTVVDLMSPLMSSFADILEYAPARTPGIRGEGSREMYEIAGAIHFALEHDDGQGLATLDQADLVILGVSRTGKTPTSIFLSCKKLKVANVPVVNALPLPPEVVRSPVRKVGFRIDLERLRQLRSERTHRLRMAVIPGYSSEADIFAELEYCERVYKAIPRLRTIDVTNLSIEEITDWITRNVL